MVPRTGTDGKWKWGMKDGRLCFVPWVVALLFFPLLSVS